MTTAWYVSVTPFMLGGLIDIAVGLFEPSESAGPARDHNLTAALAFVSGLTTQLYAPQTLSTVASAEWTMLSFPRRFR